MNRAPYSRLHPEAGWFVGPRPGRCRYCGAAIPRHRTFCTSTRARFARGGVVLEPGAGCVHEWKLRTNPGYARKFVFARDHGRCAACGLVTTEWHADHIRPVVEGGADGGLANLRTLCLACHRIETARLAARRAFRRKAARHFSRSTSPDQIPTKGE